MKSQTYAATEQDLADAALLSIYVLSRIHATSPYDDTKAIFLAHIKMSAATGVVAMNEPNSV